MAANPATGVITMQPGLIFLKSLEKCSKWLDFLFVFSVGNVTQQWMQAPSPPPGCPPGLEYLTLVDQLLCQQVVQFLILSDMCNVCSKSFHSPHSKTPGGAKRSSFSEYWMCLFELMEAFEMMTHYETKNRYVVRNSMGQQIYYAVEESGTCMRLCCGKNRGFSMPHTQQLQSGSRSQPFQNFFERTYWSPSTYSCKN